MGVIEDGTVARQGADTAVIEAAQRHGF
jgi:hypothetical protein